MASTIFGCIFSKLRIMPQHSHWFLFWLLYLLNLMFAMSSTTIMKVLPAFNTMSQGISQNIPLYSSSFNILSRDFFAVFIKSGDYIGPLHLLIIFQCILQMHSLSIPCAFSSSVQVYASPVIDNSGSSTIEKHLYQLEYHLNDLSSLNGSSICYYFIALHFIHVYCCKQFCGLCIY